MRGLIKKGEEEACLGRVMALFPPVAEEGGAVLVGMIKRVLSV